MTGVDVVALSSLRVRPPATSSTGGLSAVWAARDERYAKRSAFQQLSPANISAVRIHRIHEAGNDPVARTIAARWTPPERLT